MREPVASVIVTTYNRLDALALVLQALAAQQRRGFEVVVADDGSTADTGDAIARLGPGLPYRLKHVWQEDRGFRAAMARNRAVAASEGEYLIFLDGDCVPRVDFIARHLGLAERGWFVAGNRLLLSQGFTGRVLEERLPVWSWGVGVWLRCRLHGDINRILPVLGLPDALAFRKRHPGRWQGAKTCNLAMWREDLIKINGFDERFQGWGHEDADLVVRLQRSGVRRKEGRFAVPVLHLWHPEHDRGREAANRERLEGILRSKDVLARYGVDQYLR